MPRRAELSGGGEVAFDVFGDGPPVVLVHGTPSWSYLWRKIAPALADRFTVHAYDLPGYGDSEADEGRDISVAAQSRVLAELLELWRLRKPAVAGHDIGGGIVLRTHLLEGVPFDRIALVDAVVLRPWITPASRHVRAHLDAYRTMPTHVFEQAATAHLRTAVHRPMDERTFGAYFGQWRGQDGQRSYLQHVAQFDEGHTAEFEPLLGSMRTPVRIIWGERDAWLDVSIARRLEEELPNSNLKLIPEAGHFSMEDRPDEVAASLLDFFGQDRDGAR